MVAMETATTEGMIDVTVECDEDGGGYIVAITTPNHRFTQRCDTLDEALRAQQRALDIAEAAGCIPVTLQ